ncbi:ankyrin [Aspergillus brunneoviolaceus CBS 621.78]|uniref:Ankyrin n=1 Tax=Aspergillus brunneoviolaceus CBS 621.78 TaxID=1450534 RepID=A0ACD1GPY9_9EURO|nr:ankyrin [Aspergillus brunneoviolaceus CBS 621.78]RAH51183.1 ankyrin [Aspergillus brunneoviolaceus CBS 621.78]
MKLEKLMQYMETRFGIRASQNAYKYQFKKWGFRKNKTRDVWIWADHQKETRKASAGQKEIEIHFNGTVISDTRVRKEIARNVTTMDRIRARAASPATPQGYSASTPNGSISNQPHVPDAVTTAESDLNAVQNNDSDRKILAEIMRDSISEDSEIRANLCKHYDRAFLGGIADTMVDGKSIYENIVKDIANEISRGTGNEAYNTYIGDGVLSATVSILKAAYNDDLASLRTALDWGKQTAPNAFDEIVFIARFVAARFGRMNIAKILFTIRDHCVQRDNEENTCLHLAALFNHPEMVKFLITRQSDIESRNKDGHTPWTQIGSSEEHERVSQLLIEAGTDVNSGSKPMSPRSGIDCSGKVELCDTNDYFPKVN